MRTQIAVDAAGRVLIPKELRERLGLGTGDLLDLAEGDDRITLKPARQTLPLEKKNGFWIYTGELPAGTDRTAPHKLIVADREARADALMCNGNDRDGQC